MEKFNLLFFVGHIGNWLYPYKEQEYNNFPFFTVLKPDGLILFPLLIL